MIRYMLAFSLFSIPFAVFSEPQRMIESFAIYYGEDAVAADFKPFDLVVVESSNQTLAKALKRDKKTVLAYLSMGEVNRTRDYFGYVKEKGLVLEENPNWPDAVLIDIRKPAWEDYMLTKLIPEMIAAGFDGIFIDTLDSSLEKERVEPKAFAGMKTSALSIVKNIRKKFPKLKIMLNRAYGIAQESAPYIDFILGESICGTYDFRNKSYIPVSEEGCRYETGILKDLKEKNPKLQVMTLDYCEEGDLRRLEEIYRRQRENGFIPYVTTIGLDRITSPPLK